MRKHHIDPAHTVASCLPKGLPWGSAGMRGQRHIVVPWQVWDSQLCPCITVKAKGPKSGVLSSCILSPEAEVRFGPRTTCLLDWFLLLHNKLLQTQLLKTMHVSSQGICGSGVQAGLSWVFCSGPHKVAIRDVVLSGGPAEDGSTLKLTVAVGRIYFLALRSLRPLWGPGPMAPL